MMPAHQVLVSHEPTTMNTTDHMQITSANLRIRLQERLQPSHLDVLDESAAHAGHTGSNGTDFGTHFRVRITSPFFTNLSRVGSHRLVYDAVQDFIDQGLHALAIEIVPSK